MSFTNKTTHYEIPLPTSTDLVNGLDWNESSAAIDTAIYNASQAATTATSDITSIKSTIALLEAADVTFQQDLNAVSGRVTTLEQNQGTIADDVQDVADMITAYEEATATSSRAYNVGDPFRYNGVLYIATEAIGAGDTIVPNVNCRATNVTTEINQVYDVIDNTSELSGTVNDTYVDTLAGSFTKVGNMVMVALDLGLNGTEIPANTTICTLSGIGTVSSNEAPYLVGRGANVCNVSLKRNTGDSTLIDVINTGTYTGTSLRGSLCFRIV